MVTDPLLLLLLSLARVLLPSGLARLRRLLGDRRWISSFALKTSDDVNAAAAAAANSEPVPCLFLNYSPINTVFDWCYDHTGSISCVFIGTLLFNGNRISLIVKKMPKSGTPSQQGITQFRTSRLARYDRQPEDQFSCLFELRCCCPAALADPTGRRPARAQRLFLRGVANLHQPESHFIFVLSAESLAPLNMLFYQNSVVPDYDPFSDTICMPHKLAPVPAFALVSLHAVTFREVSRVEFPAVGGSQSQAQSPAANTETLVDRFFNVQVKVGRVFSIVLISVYIAEQSSMDYQLKVYDRQSRQIVCQTSFFESGFSFYRFLVEDDCIMFFSLMAHLKIYRIVPDDDDGGGGADVDGSGSGISIVRQLPPKCRRRIELQATRELHSCVGSRAPSLWPHKDCRHGNYVMELFAWTLQREEFNLRGIVCCGLPAYELGISADAGLLASMQAACAEDLGDNVATACMLG